MERVKVDSVSRDDFDRVCRAVWTEINYQNIMSRRTADEAKDVPGFLTLARRYIRQTEDVWADNPGVEYYDGSVQVPEALDGLRKIAAIMIRAMVYNGCKNKLAIEEIEEEQNSKDS